MRKDLKLFMVMLGCKPQGRFTEQHDIFFGIGSSLKELLPQMIEFWPEAKGKIHVDAYREVTHVDGYQIQVKKREQDTDPHQLFFLNLGGYKKNEFEEYHYKVLTITKSKSQAIKNAKESTFYKHCGFEGAPSHIDDKYGVDVDDIYTIEEILSDSIKQKYQLSFTKSSEKLEDKLHIGYLKIDNLP